MNKKTIAIMSFVSLLLLGCESEVPPQRAFRDFQDPTRSPQEQPDDIRRSDSAPLPGREEDGDRSTDAPDERADDSIKRFEDETRELMDHHENG